MVTFYKPVDLDTNFNQQKVILIVKLQNNSFTKKCVL